MEGSSLKDTEGLQQGSQTDPGQSFRPQSPQQITHLTSKQAGPTSDLRYWLALLYAPHIGPVTFRRILSVCQDLKTLFEIGPGEVLGEAIQLPRQTLAYFRHPDWNRVEQELSWSKKPDCHILHLDHPHYPALLQEIADPPPLLFVRGQPEVLSFPQLAIVGSRNPSAGGRQIAHDTAFRLTQSGLVITSGMALGIDAASHEGAMEEGMTVAVTGTGLDRIYPARHRDLAHRIVEQGAIVSEFPLGTPPVAANFPRRNRIISGLSLGTLVVEAAIQSGSLITARIAAEQGREVYAMPGSIHNPLSRGCHVLLRQGAKLVENVTDILEELGPLASVAMEAIAEGEDKKRHTYSGCDETLNPVIENMGYEPISIDRLVERCGLTPETVSSMLLTLELQGRVTSIGGLYSRTD
jgi:DNA processing protein